MPDEFNANDSQLLSELKQLLTDGEEQYREIVNSINDGVFQLNAGGYFAFVNSVIVNRAGIPDINFIACILKISSFRRIMSVCKTMLREP